MKSYLNIVPDPRGARKLNRLPCRYNKFEYLWTNNRRCKESLFILDFHEELL